uniref:Glycosyl transferase family 1 domain-containing protein n=1 Tax=Cyclophora tenuis TaxID=216820 RepID=A0A7S1D0Z9_CYCTE|mmetsp:Transcript_18032/g.30740  ORF Transcript_18032/g.30740 Transcript_18032/m.30740 type:complete len:388 (+) Transcript_18032:67-1230(+)
MFLSSCGRYFVRASSFALVAIVSTKLILESQRFLPQLLVSTTTAAQENKSNVDQWTEELLRQKHKGCELYSLDNASRKKVVIQQHLGLWSGGPEALVQLALAFHSWLPSSTYAQIYLGHRELACDRYPQFCDINLLLDYSDLRSGDVLIIPELMMCPQHLVRKGVNVFVWQLGATSFDARRNQTEEGCKHISHNYWLSSQFGLNLPSSHILVPYISENKLYNGTFSNEKRENLILINGHDAASLELTYIREYCESRNCSTQVLINFGNAELMDLYSKAKMIVSFCMRGSERSPIEAVLRGVVLVSNNCQSAEDGRDFPIPRNNLVPILNGSTAVADIVERVMENFSVEQARYSAMRSLYMHYGRQTLSADTRCFMQAIENSSSVNYR